MSNTLEIPDTLPEDSRKLLSRFLADIGAESANAAQEIRAAARFSVALLLPRFAGTMLKLLRDGRYEATELLERAAECQGKDSDNPRIQFRLVLALDYLKRTGCAEPTARSIRATPFGREVYRTRFETQAPTSETEVDARE